MESSSNVLVVPALSGTSLHRIWGVEPIYQLGTPWLSTATPLDIDVIFWLSLVKNIFSLITGLIICSCESTTTKTETDQDYEMLHHQKVTRTSLHGFPWVWLVLSGTVIPVLGIFSIMLDSEETLNVFCVIIIFALVGGFHNLAVRFRGGFNAGVAVSIIFLAVGMALEIVSIVFAWKYAFAASVASQI